MIAALMPQLADFLRSTVTATETESVVPKYEGRHESIQQDPEQKKTYEWQQSKPN
jgi:hypothetical protein